MDLKVTVLSLPEKNGLTSKKKLVVVVDCFSFHDRMYGGAGHAP